MTTKPPKRFDWLQDAAAWLSAALVVGVVLTLADAVTRHRWGDGGVLRESLSALRCVYTLLLPALTAAGAAWVVLIHSPWRRWLRAAVVGTVAAVAAMPTLFWAFSGRWIKSHPLAPWGPPTLALTFGMLAMLVFVPVDGAVRGQTLGRFRRARWTALTLVLLALLGVYADQHVYVALYTRLHSGLEAVCLTLLCVALSLLVREPLIRRGTFFLPARRRPRLLLGGGLLLGLVFWGVTLPLYSEQSFAALESKLLHGYKDPVYAGRYLKRLKASRAFLRDPSNWRGAERAALDELQQEYDLESPQLDPIWTEPNLVTPSGLCSGCNVLVFYVDTLRRDVALDPRYMPNVSRFSRSALNFERAYAAGSDTLTSLPALVSGQYAPREQSPAELLLLAQRAGMKRVLSIPKSAWQFLSKLYPPFAFDEVLEVEDYAPDHAGVWGYGANKPSAAAGVDRLLEWLGEHRDERFFAWTFNFELHNWRELDEQHTAAAADRAGLTREDKRWRYRALAHEADRQFGRLLRGMASLGLMDNTILLVISDHGEALGQWDFWLHSVVVWESLIRVPLLLKIPQLAPRQIETAVSLTDVLPTLASLLAAATPAAHPRDKIAEPEAAPGASASSAVLPASVSRGSPRSTAPAAVGDQARAERAEAPAAPLRLAGHGASLLDTLNGISRTRPVLFVGERKQQLVRIGALDTDSSLKLVLPLETGKPELYDTALAAPDDLDFAEQSPIRVARLLDTLVRSPMFPRQDESNSDRSMSK